MEINPRLFDKHGRLRLGRGSISCTRWHPLYPEQPYLAVGLTSGEIVILRVEHSAKERRISMEAVQEFPPMPRGNPVDLDWGPGKGEDAGRYLAVAERWVGVVRVLDVEQNREQAVLQVGHAVTNVVFNSDGGLLAVGTELGPVFVFRTADGSLLREFGNSREAFNYLSFHPDGRRLAISSPFGILDVTNGNWQPLEPIARSQHWHHHPSAFSPDGHYLLTSDPVDHPMSPNTTASLLTLRDGRSGTPVQSALVRRRLMGWFNPKSVWGMNSDAILYLRSDDFPANHRRSLVLQAVLDAKVVSEWAIGGDAWSADSMSPDGSLLLRGKQVYALGDNGAVCSLPKSTSETLRVFSPCGAWMIAQSDQDIVRRDLPNLSVVGRYNDELDRRLFLRPSVTPDAQYVIFTKKGGAMLLCNARDGRVGVMLHGHECSAYCGAVSPDARYLVSRSASLGNHPRRLLLHDLTTGRLIPGFADGSDRDTGDGYGTAISPDGRHVVCGSRGLALPQGNVTADFQGSGYLLGKCDKVIGFGPDGTWFITTTHSGVVSRCEAMSGREQFSSEFGLQNAEQVAISPCGRWLIVVGHQGIVLLSAANWHERVLLSERYQESYDDAAFSPDGRFLFVTSHLGSVILDLERVLGAEWFAEYQAAPLILTAVWFPKGSLDYLRESDQGNIVTVRPLARCGECGRFFPVDDTMLGQEVRCPNERQGQRCNRLLKLNPFIAGFQDPEVC